MNPELLLDTSLHADGDPHALWQWMRSHAPLHHHPPGEYPPLWSVTRYEDCRSVLQDAEHFTNFYGVLIRQAGHGDDPGGGLTLAATDPPLHRELRSQIADRFTLRCARDQEEAMRTATRALLDEAVERGTCDFVHDIAAPLSTAIICRLMGVPASDLPMVQDWTREAFETGKPLTAHGSLMRYFIGLMEDRMDNPAADLVSDLAYGTLGGELLSEKAILINCENLMGATENAGLAMASGMLAFLQHPGEWRRLREDRELMPGAIEEILRYTSSGTHILRTVAQPTILRGQALEPGERVVLWLPSANRDEEVFAEPGRFDIGRRPNRHLALGAGEHVCVGATMARVQARILLTELLDQRIGVELAGPPGRLRSLAVSGLAHLPVRMSRTPGP